MGNKNTQTTNIFLGDHKRNVSKKDGKPNWLLRLIVWGLIALGVAIASYYLTQPSDQIQESGLRFFLH